MLPLTHKTIYTFKENIFQINKNNFDIHSQEVFQFQYKSNEPYKNYVNNLKRKVDSSIPVFLPIRFYKNHKIISTDSEKAIVFRSSGTTDTARSLNYLSDPNFYHRISRFVFESQYFPLKDVSILALLPSYLEQGQSSLVFMVDHFIKRSESPFSGFYLNDYELLKKQLENSLHKGRKTILFGVTFALIEFGERRSIRDEKLMIIETGGMKGRGKDLTKRELHEQLKLLYGTKLIHSEYGMTELMSQAYTRDDGRFVAPPWMKIRIRDLNDPFTECPDGKAGGINIIDLANVETCSFIETQDLGIRYPDGTFEVLGRFDNSDLRGCNLLIG